MSVMSYNPSVVVEVSKLVEAKKRILSMDNIKLEAAPPQREVSDEKDGDIFANPEDKFSEPIARINHKEPITKTLPIRSKKLNCNLPKKSTIAFHKILREPTCTSKNFVKQFQLQKAESARKNAKSVFATLGSAIPFGEELTVSIHDYMWPVVRPGREKRKVLSPTRDRYSPATKSSQKGVKDKRNKNSGMVIFVDPSIDTTNIECTLHVSYGRNFSEIESYPICNDGTYCGIEVTGAKWNLDHVNPIVSPEKTTSHFDLNKLAASFEYRTTEKHLPGWGGTLPIFIPSDSCRCKLEIRRHKNNDLSQSPLRFYHGPDSVGSGTRSVPHSSLQRPKTAPLPPLRTPTAPSIQNGDASNMDSLSIFCFGASSIDSALRTVNKCLGPKLKTFVANGDAGGGSSVLNIAALHGNIQVFLH